MPSPRAEFRYQRMQRTRGLGRGEAPRTQQYQGGLTDPGSGCSLTGLLPDSPPPRSGLPGPPPLGSTPFGGRTSLPHRDIYLLYISVVVPCSNRELSRVIKGVIEAVIGGILGRYPAQIGGAEQFRNNILFELFPKVIVFLWKTCGKLSISLGRVGAGRFPQTCGKNSDLTAKKGVFGCFWGQNASI